MKKYINIVFVIIAISLSSCLKSNLEDLPEFENNDITAIPRVEYRFVSEEISNASNQHLVKFINLTIENVNIDNEAKTVDFTVKVPNSNSTFTEIERKKLSLSNLAVIVNLSTAARIFPIEGSPKLGVPGDWSKPNKYRVVAANGDTAEWTIKITSLIK